MQWMNENFIGRTKELSQLMRWLENTNGSRIFYLYDALEDPTKKGGIGKTWLLRKFMANLVEQQKKFIPVFFDLFNITDRNALFRARRVYQDINKEYPHWVPQKSIKIIELYQEALKNNANTTEILTHLSDAFSADLRTLDALLVPEDRYLLLIFDTFELIEDNPITAVLQTAHTFPDTYDFERLRFVIAGRNELNMKHPNWIGREQEITIASLSPFSYEEAIAYLTYFDKDLQKDYTLETLSAIYARTEGRPILLGLVNDVLHKQEVKLENLIEIAQDSFEESLVEQIDGFGDAIKWATHFMAHIFHRFDLEFLSLIMSTPGLADYIPTTEYQQLLTQLPELTFIRHSSSSNAFVLHDEMKRLVNKHCWDRQDPTKVLRRELSRLAVTYYNKKIEQEENEVTHQSYRVELLFHNLFMSVDEGFKSFEEQFAHAIKFSARSFARSLFHEVQKFTMQLSMEQQRTLLMDEAILLHEEESFAAELQIYEELERDNAWTESHRSDLLARRGACYLRLSQYDLSIACFKDAVEIERSNPNRSSYAALLSRLGYVHRLQGRYTEAMRYYQDALNVQRYLDNPEEHATLLNNIGNAMRLLGIDLEEALRYCKIALRIRRDLFNQGKVSEADLALSYNTLGHIYHTLGTLVDEERAYRDAFAIYNRLGDNDSIAHTHNNLGRVLVARGDFKGARAEFEQALRIAANVNHIATIESLNQQGRLCLLQEDWEQAMHFFDSAISISRQFHYRFQLAENLLYLADALDHLEQPSNEQIKEAKHIARENDYSYLLARAGEIQGDICFRRYEYQSAFKYYRVACRYMAQRSLSEFEKTIRKLNDQLLEVPSGFLPGVIDSLLSYWYELKLNEQYPQLLFVCREVSRNMLL